MSLLAGFNTGFNCAESCNFATQAWVEIGEDARPCECVSDTVRLDMSIFEDNVCGRVDVDDYTAVKRARVGAPQKRPPSERHKEEAEERAEKKSKKISGGAGASSAAGAAGGGGGGGGCGDSGLKLNVPPVGDGGVLVPQGWKRTVVMKHKASVGAGSSSKAGAKTYAACDRDTFYKSPCGKTLKSKDEVARYLGSNPDCGATVRDFYFETSAKDLPPARLSAPGTPSPSASNDGGSGGGSGVRTMLGLAGRKTVSVNSPKAAKDQALKVAVGGKGKGGVTKKKVAAKKGLGRNGDATSPKTPRTPAVSGGGRDSLGGLLSPLFFDLSSGDTAPLNQRVVMTAGGHSRVGSRGAASPPPG